MIKTFISESDFNSWLNGEQLMSKVVVYIVENETYHFATNNVDGVYSTYSGTYDVITADKKYPQSIRESINHHQETLHPKPQVDKYANPSLSNLTDDGHAKIKEVVKPINKEEWVKFTANEDSTIGYTLAGGVEADIEINKTGYSEDTEKWDGSTINLLSNESVFVRNLKPNTDQTTKIYLQFNITGDVSLDGKCSVLRDATKNYGCFSLFKMCEGLRRLNIDFFDFDSIGENGLGGVFLRCTLLEISPNLTVSNVNISGYNNMFNGCSNLKYVRCNATNLGSMTTTKTSANWMNGVSTTGVFYKNPTTTIERGTSTIPDGWVVKDWVTDKTTEERIEELESKIKELEDKLNG